MPVVALTENELLIDVFGENKKIIESDGYVVKNNKMVSINGNTVFFIDLLTMQTTEATIMGYSEMKMSEDGCKVAIINSKKQIMLFNNSIKVQEISNVEIYDISDNYLAFTTNEETIIFDLKKNEFIFSSPVMAMSIVSKKSFILFATEKNAKKTQSLLIWRNLKITQLLERPNIYKIKVCANEDESRILILADVEYFSGSYYAESILYLLQPLLKNPDKENKALTLIFNDDEIQFSSFQSLKKIHDFGFLKNQFYVCFGNQPSTLHLYSQDGLFLKKYLKCNRNRVFFNKRRNMIINCGLGNLPGYIQVSEDEETLCNFELLGASTVSWINNDSQFLVAITNYLKTDNKIVVYDYYGRIINKFECKSLVSCHVYGSEEDLIDAVKPEVAIITLEKAAYVPPHLLSDPSFGVKPSKPQKNTKYMKNSKEVKSRPIKVVEKELSEALELKERMSNHEDLTLEEESKVFKINNLQEELKKLTNK